MKKGTLNGFSLLILGLCSCSDFGDDVKLHLTGSVRDFFPPIIVEITGDVIEFTNSTPLTVYYDSLSPLCDHCGNLPVCTNHDSCNHISPNDTAVLDYKEGGVIIRWWHLIPDEQGNGHHPDEVRYIQIP